MTVSSKIFSRALRKIPGGVNSPVRAWKSVGGTPLYIARGKGSYIYDERGKRYIDFVGSWGPLILGHAQPEILHALTRTAAKGTTFGAPISSGTEATMSAIRLARAFTKRTKLIKFDGCYHGHSDGLLVKAGSGVATLGLPDSPGVPAGYARETLTAKYNDIQSLQKLFSQHGKNIAAVIVEPICGNMGVILPQPGFLATLRQVTKRHGALLIFDEVITGFRVALGGAQQLFNVKPDLTCLGKILGGGLPLAAFGGRRAIMDQLAPVGPVYQAGTLSGNPLAVAAGMTTLKLLSRTGTYADLAARGKRLEDGIGAVLTKYEIKAAINRIGSMMTVFFGVDRVENPDDARLCDRARFANYFHGMLQRGIYLPPAPFEAMFISLAHSTADLDKTISAFEGWARSANRG
jgi:glutamate-1-semialdehyde 2,1-aminomutase